MTLAFGKAAVKLCSAKPIPTTINAQGVVAVATNAALLSITSGNCSPVRLQPVPIRMPNTMGFLKMFLRAIRNFFQHAI